jgi:hypothetical protein
MTRSLRAALLAGLLAALPAAAPRAFPEPSGAVLSRLQGALGLLTEADVLTTYRIRTRFEISDGRGKVLQTIELVEKVTLEPGKPVRRETISRTSTGNATDAQSGASRRSGSQDQAGWKIVFPVGKDLPLFAFGPERRQGLLASADFAPAPSASTQDGLTRGTLSWDPAAGMPTRLVAVPVKNPPFTTRLDLSFTFASVDGFAYPATAAFSAEGGFLFFRRGIESVSTITELSRSQ